MRVSTNSTISLALVTLCGALFTSATVAEAGVVVDPNGPAGKQYSADLDRARQQGSGSNGTAGVPGSTSKAPLFGAGVKSKGDPSGPNGSGGDGSGGVRSGPGSSSSVSASIGSGGSGVNAPEIAGISLAVVLCGGLIALVIRRGTLGRST